MALSLKVEPYALEAQGRVQNTALSYQKSFKPIRLQRNSIRKINSLLDKEVIRGCTVCNGDGRLPRGDDRKVDVRYLQSIKSFRDKIRSSYYQACNQQHCKMIQERLDEHHREHHSNVKVLPLGNPELFSESSSTSQDQKISISPVESCASPDVCQKLKESHSEHTGINTVKLPYLQDYGHGPIPSENIPEESKLIDSVKHDIGTLKTTDTQEVLAPRHMFYEENIRNEAKKWMKKLPMYADTNSETEMLKDNVINELIENICGISHSIDNKNYEQNLIFEITKCVNELPIWMPGIENKQGSFKDAFIVDLFNNIKELNDRLVRKDTSNSSKNRAIHFNDVIDNKTTDSTKYLADVDIHIIENEIKEWLSSIQMEKDLSGKGVNADDVQQLLLNKLEYLLKEPKVAAQYKFTLKGEILTVLKTLPIIVKRPASRMVYLYRLADNLANRLLSVQARHAKQRFNKIQNIMLQHRVHEIMNFEAPIVMSNNLFTVISECLENSGIQYNKEIEKEIASIVLKSLDMYSGKNISPGHKNNLVKILLNNCDVSADKATDIANYIVTRVSTMLRVDDTVNFATEIKPRLSGIISVYTSEEQNPAPTYPITSTPKRVTIPKSEIPRQSPEEINLTLNLAEAIEQWLNSLPNMLNKSEDRSFKEAIVNDLAATVVETLRNLQLTPSLVTEDAVMYNISDWIIKFRLFTNYEENLEYIRDLFARIFDRIQKIPILTHPQYGGRQAMGHLKYREHHPYPEYQPKALDILEDEISIWMHHQPADIYVDNDRDIRSKMIHELAENVQRHLVNKRPESEIKNDVRLWLNFVVNTNARAYVPEMTDELYNILKQLPQDATLGKVHLQRLREAMESYWERENAVKPSHDETLIEKTMKEFIQKFIKQYYVVDDPFARRALTRILKLELMKLKPPTRKEVYDNFANSEPNALFAPEKFVQELEYIKLLADWLKSLPLDPKYRALENKYTVNFIQYIAKYITAIENERSRAPGAMNYDLHLANIIMSYLNILPIHSEQKANMARLIDRLLMKLATYRESIQQKASEAPIIDNLGDFINEYVRKYGQDVYDNEIKMEVWADRLMTEIQKIVHETSNPAELTQTQVYNRLAQVSLPLDDTVDSFVLEMNYIKEIIAWMQNLPLSPITSTEDEDKRVEMVSELAEKLHNRKINKMLAPEDTKLDTDLQEYISDWISRLSLEPRHEIVVPVLIQQLLNRINKENTSEPWDISITDVTRSTNVGVIRPEPKPRTSLLKSKNYVNNPEALIVDTVEKFCNALPIRGDNQEAIKSKKDEVMKKVLQKTGELNMNPPLFNNPPLYRDVFTNEVNDIIKEAPINTNAAKSIEKLKENLIETILDANEVIKEKSAGEEYKHKLENVINASVPSPVRTESLSEPGFEMYKNRLVNMFILENFDHSGDEIKLKYEKQVRSEIDRYFQCAQNKSAIPLTKNQIYNELYSALFKVPIPNEAAVIDEAEIIKTRCEIDNWFEKLPLTEPIDLNEHLQWDLKLATIAKKIHEIEKYEQNAHDKILKEIKRWLPRLPFLPGMENRYDEFANRLHNALKCTAEARKCIASKSRKGGKVKGKKSKEQVKPSVTAPKPKTPTPCCRSPSTPRAKPTELLIEAVEEWCQQLPLIDNTTADLERHKEFINEIFTRLIRTVTELNDDPEIFANDLMYNQLLDEELQNILNLFPTNYDAHLSNEARKHHLKKQINSIKTLIKKERDRLNYKENLKDTVISILEPPANTTPEKQELFNNLVEGIVEDFVQLHYNRNDEDGRQFYKSKVQEAVVKQFFEIRDHAGTKPAVNPLIKINQLLCELAKVPLPDPETLKDEVEEIKMREEVNGFFNKVPFPDKSEENINIRTQVKLSLAKHLTDLEKGGHNCTNDNKMKTEIARHLKKVNVEVMPQVIDAFVEQLKNNEVERKTPPPGDENFNLSQLRDQFDRIQLRPFNKPPNLSGTNMEDTKFSPSNIRWAHGMLSGPRFTQMLAPSDRLTVPGTGTGLAVSGESRGPSPRSRVGFTSQPTTHVISRPAEPLETRSSDEDNRCKCGGRRVRMGGRRPTCILRRDPEDGRQYCEPMPKMWRRPPCSHYMHF